MRAITWVPHILKNYYPYIAFLVLHEIGNRGHKQRGSQALVEERMKGFHYIGKNKTKHENHILDICCRRGRLHQALTI